MALAGAKQLAIEVRDFWLGRGEGPLLVFLPGGTCSTAVLLHRALKELIPAQNANTHDIQVVVVPCVGDEEYARRQMQSLNAAIGVEATEDIPLILAPGPEAACADQYFQFGEPDAQILETFRGMEEEHEIPMDLLYNAPAWTVLLRHWKTTFSSDKKYADKAIMYIHSGGLEGVNSQLLRYKYKGLVDLDDVQLPGRNR